MFHIDCKFHFTDEINIARSMWNGSKKVLISEINRQKRLIYYFARISGLRTIIEVDEVWAEYLLKHKEILKGWTQLKCLWRTGNYFIYNQFHYT